MAEATADNIIQVLPETLANKIAAGEVVQRPASVVKELLENAVDAGADQVTVVVQKAGRELIQVIDNGCGMSAEDAAVCFERHATSKIREAGDLDCIQTLGFRGEALASIAAVAQVELRTKRVTDTSGTRLRIDGGKPHPLEPCATPNGTMIAVRNLYFNVPARRNFLKSPATEFKHIVETFQFIALSNPRIGFKLIHDGNEVFNLSPADVGSDVLDALKQRVADLFGNRQMGSLVPVSEHSSYLNIEGFVGKPNFSRKMRGEQFFFVNGRYVKHRALDHAVASGYGEILPKGSYPFFVLFLRLDPRHVDVNVHPTKAEVKFDDERGLYGFVRSVVKEALGQNNITPDVGFTPASRLTERTSKPASGWSIPTSTPKPPMPAPSVERPRFEKREIERPVASIDSVEAMFQTDPPPPVSAPEPTVTSNELPQTSGADPLMWQLSDKYVLVQIEDGMMIMDQHAAHERILYEKFLYAIEQGHSPSQQLLFPHTLEFSPGDLALLMDLLPDLQKLGFDLEPFGGQSIIVRGVPNDIPPGRERDSLDEVLQQFKSYRDVYQLKDRDNLAKSLACRSAIKTGKRLSRKEMQQLLDQLMGCDMPYACPHGRPTMIRIPLEELDKRFGRVGHLERE